jgi:ParB/RepB/Spo0J family partition protein
VQQLPIEEIKFTDIKIDENGMRNGRTGVEDITSLRESIETNGLMDPLIVWKTEDDKYILTAGYRRHAAISQLREEISEEAFDTIRVSIFTGTLEEALAKNLEENIQRRNLNPADEAIAVSRLYRKVGDQTDVARMLGMSQPWVSQRVNLVKGLIARGMDMLRRGSIVLKDAIALSKLLNNDGTPNEDLQNELLDALEEDEKEGKVKIPKPDRAKTYRTKKEIDELELIVVEATNDDAIDSVVSSVLKRVIAWHRCQIDSEELLFTAPSEEDASDASEADIIDITPSLEEEAPVARIASGE